MLKVPCLLPSERYRVTDWLARVTPDLSSLVWWQARLVGRWHGRCLSEAPEAGLEGITAVGWPLYSAVGRDSMPVTSPPDRRVTGVCLGPCCACVPLLLWFVKCCRHSCFTSAHTSKEQGGCPVRVSWPVTVPRNSDVTAQCSLNNQGV